MNKEFIAVVLLETEHLETGVKSYEETFLQISAGDEIIAEAKASSYGKACATIYENEKGQQLSVSFVGVHDCNPVLREVAEEGVRELYTRSYQHNQS